MTRAQLIVRLRVAGYHDDQAGLVRLYVENRIAYNIALRAYREGEQLREAGIRCDCVSCQEKANAS